mmetsp:Transcript_65743/g.183098  ORF Transcript_65743/g.183098 Transcript_65743/m.183098 type:complete len:210 (+) Transcript_65743:202-831(+)
MRRLVFASINVSSTPTCTGAPPGSSDKPPGWTMVYVISVSLHISIKCISAFRFHMTILSPSPSPMLFRKLSFCVPVIVPITMTCFTPASFAHSNWVLCPSQSTCSGFPPFQLKRNLPFRLNNLANKKGINDQNLSFGTAEVATITAATPAKAPAMLSFDWISPTVTLDSGNISTADNNFSLLCSEWTSALTSNRPLRTSFSTMILPVRP